MNFIAACIKRIFHKFDLIENTGFIFPQKRSFDIFTPKLQALHWTQIPYFVEEVIFFRSNKNRPKQFRLQSLNQPKLDKKVFCPKSLAFLLRLTQREIKFTKLLLLLENYLLNHPAHYQPQNPFVIANNFGTRFYAIYPEKAFFVHRISTVLKTIIWKNEGTQSYSVSQGSQRDVLGSPKRD